MRWMIAILILAILLNATATLLVVERLEAAGVEVAPRGRSTLVSFAVEDPPAARERVLAAGIVLRDLPGTPYLRASVGAWTTEEELDRLAGIAAA